MDTRPIYLGVWILQCRKVKQLKSHDCYVLMQQLLPIALRCSLLVKSVYSSVTELYNFYRELCSKEHKRKTLTHWKKVCHHFTQTWGDLLPFIFRIWFIWSYTWLERLIFAGWCIVSECILLRGTYTTSILIFYVPSFFSRDIFGYFFNNVDVCSKCILLKR